MSGDVLWDILEMFYGIFWRCSMGYFGDVLWDILEMLNGDNNEI